jgi:uncharacterized protein (DUF983 family)
MAVVPKPAAFGVMVLRAIRLRCPHCGGQGWIERWFTRLPRCRTCGYKVQREDGFDVGALIVNIIVTFAAIVVTVGTAIVVTYPDLPVGPTMAVGLVVAVVVPIVMLPISHTLWAAVDLTMHPLEAAELADAERHRPGGAPTA